MSTRVILREGQSCMIPTGNGYGRIRRLKNAWGYRPAPDHPEMRAHFPIIVSCGLLQTETTGDLSIEGNLPYLMERNFIVPEFAETAEERIWLAIQNLALSPNPRPDVYQELMQDIVDFGNDILRQRPSKEAALSKIIIDISEKRLVAAILKARKLAERSRTTVSNTEIAWDFTQN